MTARSVLRATSALGVGALLAGCTAIGGTTGTRPWGSEAVRQPVTSTSTTRTPSTPSTTSSPAHQVPIPAGWVDEEVSFATASGTAYGSYLHPRTSIAVPGVLLIAGSGPTDRNGDSGTLTLGSLRAMAGMLANAGVASLRYDKIGSGKTGTGTLLLPDLQKIGVSPFLDQAARALGFLAAQPGIDPTRLYAVGHSEGALYALLLAVQPPAGTPRLHGLGLIEGLSSRYLDLIAAQLHGQVVSALAAGSLTAAEGAQIDQSVAAAVAAIRAGKPLPTMPPTLAGLFNPSVVVYLREADALDPVVLAGRLPRGMPVLFTCSDADIQVSCADVAKVAAAIPGPTTDFVTLHGVSHVLKVDASKTVGSYTADLEFSPDLAAALARLVRA